MGRSAPAGCRYCACVHAYASFEKSPRKLTVFPVESAEVAVADGRNVGHGALAGAESLGRAVDALADLGRVRGQLGKQVGGKLAEL